MITLITESTQLIQVSNKTELKQSVINYALLTAKANRRYAKFYSNKYYIEVTFQRDNTVRIASNYRTNVMFNKQLVKLDSMPFRIGSVTNFIWLWMNRLRKM